VDLHAVNVHLADMVIILSPPHLSLENLGDAEKSTLSDKEVIMVTMNLRGEYKTATQWVFRATLTMSLQHASTKN